MDQQFHSLLDSVTGIKEVIDPDSLSDKHYQEARQLIEDPAIPNSDLRGTRDLQKHSEMNNL